MHNAFLGSMLPAKYSLPFTFKPDSVDVEAENRASYWLSKTTRPDEEVSCFAGCSKRLLEPLCVMSNTAKQHGSMMFDEDTLSPLRTSLKSRFNVLQQRELLRREDLARGNSSPYQLPVERVAPVHSDPSSSCPTTPIRAAAKGGPGGQGMGLHCA